jgi:glycosyltransferase involved in cell wall biosynthesis
MTMYQSATGRRRASASSPRNSRLRVLYVIGFLAPDGGAERFALGLATRLPRDRFEPWMCAPRGADPAVVAALGHAGIPFIDLGRRARWDVHRLAGLPRLLREEQFEVLHTHMFGSNLWGALAGRACHVPVVIAQEHTWSYEGNPVRAWLDGHVIGRLADRFVAVSSADAERMVRIEKVPAAKVTIIPTAYVPRDQNASGDLRSELGLGRDTPLYGTAAVMRPQKALEVLLEAHSVLLEAVPAAHLVVAGDGTCRGQLERRVDELRIGNSVHLLGRRGDVDSIIRALNVAAMSSDYEGTPLFALECMANRTPLVATAVGGLREIVEHDRTGLLVPRRQPEQLAQAVKSLLLDSARGDRLAAAAAAKLEGYTIESVVSRFGELYESLYAGAQAQRAATLGRTPEWVK